MTPDPIAIAAARVEASAAFLQSPALVAVLVEGMQSAVIRMNSPWLSRQEAATYARCSVGEINRVANLGIIKKYYRGGSPLFKRTEIDEAIESGRWLQAPKQEKKKS